MSRDVEVGSIVSCEESTLSPVYGANLCIFVVKMCVLLVDTTTASFARPFPDDPGSSVFPESSFFLHVFARAPPGISAHGFYLSPLDGVGEGVMFLGCLSTRSVSQQAIEASMSTLRAGCVSCHTADGVNSLKTLIDSVESFCVCIAGGPW